MALDVTPSTGGVASAIAFGPVCFKSNGTFLGGFKALEVAGDGSFLPAEESDFDPYRCRKPGTRLRIPASIATSISTRYVAASRARVSAGGLVLAGEFDRRRRQFVVRRTLDPDAGWSVTLHQLEPDVLAAGPASNVPGDGLGKRMGPRGEWLYYPVSPPKTVDATALASLVAQTPAAVVWSSSTAVVLQAPVVAQSVVDTFLNTGARLTVVSAIRTP